MSTKKTKKPSKKARDLVDDLKSGCYNHGSRPGSNATQEWVDDARKKLETYIALLEVDRKELHRMQGKI